MDREQRSQRRAPAEPDLFLQWGNRKRLRCVKVRDDDAAAGGGQRRTATRVNRRILRGVEKDQHVSSPPPPPPPPPLAAPHPAPSHNHRVSESAGSESRKPTRSVSSSPEKEDRFYTTRGSAAVAAAVYEENNGNGVGDEKGVAALPRFFLSLSNKEKEEDFMAMKGCKLPQRPKKRAKFIQKSILLVSPGAWLTDLSQERYEVREKKSSKKRRRGLKAMSMESDSE